MNIRFGISFTQTEYFSRAGSKLPEGFSALEIPGDLLDSSSACSKLKNLSRQGITLCARDLIAPEIAGLIPAENCKLRAELEQHFAGRCAAAAEIGISDLTTVFDLAGALENPESSSQLVRFLKRCAGVIYANGQTLRLQLRLPAGNGAPPWRAFYLLRRDLLCPNIEWTIELHPHEPAAPEQLEQMLPLFRGYDRFRRVCYNAETGNKLTPGALKCCCRTADDTAEPLTLLLFPGNTPLEAETVDAVKNFRLD